MALTKRQREIFDWIAKFIKQSGYSPSFEEIGDGLGLSSLATIHKHLVNLERKGMLTRDYNRSRSITIGRREKWTFKCGHCGKDSSVSLL